MQLNSKQLSVFLCLTATCGLAFAAPLGGLEETSTFAKAVQNWLSSTGVTLAGIVLFVSVIGALANKITWLQVGYVVGGIAVLGGVPALAIYAYNFFQS